MRSVTMLKLALAYIAMNCKHIMNEASTVQPAKLFTEPYTLLRVALIHSLDVSEHADTSDTTTEESRSPIASTVALTITREPTSIF